MPRLGLTILLGAGLLASAPRLAAQEVTYFGGASWATGSYVFDRSSNTFMLSNGLRLRVGAVDVGVSVPLTAYDGGLMTTVIQGSTVPTGGSQHEQIADRQPGETLGTRRGRSGGSSTQDSVLVFDDAYSLAVGDPYLTANGQIHSGMGALRAVSLSAGAKVPVSDPDSGLGSGAWDFGAGASAIVAAGRTLILADLSYRWVGDLPDLELRDGVAYMLGFSRPAFSGSGSVLLALSGMTPIVEGMEAPVTVLASLGRSTGGGAFVSFGVGFGLTESAPDVSVNLGWSVPLGS